MDIRNDARVLPALAIDLIEELNKAVPEMCPNATMSDREIWMYAGKRELIRSLLSRQTYTAASDDTAGGM
jgi:hypothetical protein